MSQNFFKLFLPLIKPITKLELIQKNKDFPAIETHFGGNPYFESEETWPVCPNCEKELEFICQIDYSKGFHQKHSDIKLFTFFYCFECSPWGLSDEKPGEWVVRTYSNPTKEKAVKINNPKTHETFIKTCAVQISEEKSLPDWEGISERDEKIAAASNSLNPDEPWEPYQSFVEENLGEQDFGTFLGGYPLWIQSEETPHCAKCKKKMNLLAQIDSEETAGIMWGDSGAVYLFYCFEHPKEIRLVLQCY